MGFSNAATLIELSNPGYRQHCAHHTFLNRVGKGETVPDHRQVVAQLIEDNSREFLSKTWNLTRYRVVRWNEKISGYPSKFRYRELDGVFDLGAQSYLILEVKASASKGSVTSGIKQLNSTLNTLSSSYPKSAGILLTADMNKWSEDYGPAYERSLNDRFPDIEIVDIDWPPVLDTIIPGMIYVARLPMDLIYAWLPSSENDLS